MSLFRYSGLTTKVRAMSGALLSKEDFDQISTLGNVPEVVAWLKKKPSYGKVLGNENENTMHRGQAEGRIKRSFYADFSKLYRFSNMEQRNFLDTYFRRYEITCLKNIVQAILSDSPTLADVSDYEEAFAKHSAFPLKKAASADSMETLVSVLSDTPYGDVLRKVAGSGSTTLFDYEFALDMFQGSLEACQKRIEKRRPGSSAGIGGCCNRYPESAVDLPCQTLLRDESGRCLCPDHSGALPAEPGAGQTNGGGGEHRRNVELRKRNQVWKISAGNGKTESGTGRQYDPGKRTPCADETEPLFSCMPGSLFI